MDRRTLLAQGREAEVFLQPDGTVLKLLRDPTAAHRARREAAALRALAGEGLEAPSVLDVVTVDGRPGLVLERAEGEDLFGRLGRRPVSLFTPGRVMAEAHAAMHECRAPDELPDLVDELRGRIETAPPLPDAMRTTVLALLDRMPRGDRLCHGDFHLGNMIGSWSRSVVIDWGDAARGDPVADVARSELLLRLGEPPPGTSLVIRLIAPAARSSLAGRYLGCYRRRHPVDRELLDRWKVVRAAARLREPIPEEHPRLLRFLDQRLDAVAG